MKVDLSPSAPLPYYRDIFHNFVIPIESFKELVSDDVISDHTQNLWDVSFKSKCRDEISSLLDLSNPSFDHHEESKGEISCFQSSLFMIHQIMRVPLFLISKFLIMAVVISSMAHLTKPSQTELFRLGTRGI